VREHRPPALPRAPLPLALPRTLIPLAHFTRSDGMTLARTNYLPPSRRKPGKLPLRAERQPGYQTCRGSPGPRW
jgi:hypothetical protein